MKCNLSLKSFGAVVAFALVAPTPAAAYDWTDDFEDGVFMDGNPPCESPTCWRDTTCNPGSVQIRDGALWLQNTDPGWSYAVAHTRRIEGDVTVRTQCRVVGIPGGTIVVLGWTLPCASGYLAGISEDGALALGRYDGQLPVVQLRQVPLLNFEPDADHVLEFERRGDFLVLTCWRADAPDEPTGRLEIPDRTYLSGHTGIGYTRWTDDPNSWGVFEYFQVSTPEPSAPFRRGDANVDGAVNLSDAVFALRALFAPGAEPLSCDDAADTDNNEALNLTDGVYLLDCLFRGTAQPPAPFVTCGQDPGDDNDDALGCDAFDACEPQ